MSSRLVQRWPVSHRKLEVEHRMSLIAEPVSSTVRPILRGRLGAVSAAHPLAVAGGQEMLLAGGTAADAAIGAQAVLCVVMPDACSLGGDMLALAHMPGSVPL